MGYSTFPACLYKDTVEGYQTNKVDSSQCVLHDIFAWKLNPYRQLCCYRGKQVVHIIPCLKPGLTFTIKSVYIFTLHYLLKNKLQHFFSQWIYHYYYLFLQLYSDKNITLRETEPLLFVIHSYYYLKTKWLPFGMNIFHKYLRSQVVL